MIFRFNGFSKVLCDLEDLYNGSCILLGGAPNANQENLALLRDPNVVVVGMNNVPAAFPGIVNISLTADKPICYSSKILMDRSMTHFAGLGKAYETISTPAGDVQWKDMPNTFFYSASDDVTINNFLDVVRLKFAWWKNIFPIAIQLCYYLGFRTVYTLGCSFKIDMTCKAPAYSFDKNLTKEQKVWNANTYGHCVTWMQELQPHLVKHGMHVISCTKDSLINDTYGYITMEDAIAKIKHQFPTKYDLSKVKHSSELQIKQK